MVTFVGGIIGCIVGIIKYSNSTGDAKNIFTPIKGSMTFLLFCEEESGEDDCL